jgi:hypothetical protein
LEGIQIADDEKTRQIMREIGFTEEQIDKTFAREHLYTQAEGDDLADFMAADMTTHVPHSIDAEGVQHFDVDALRARLQAWTVFAAELEEDPESGAGNVDEDEDDAADKN